MVNLKKGSMINGNTIYHAGIPEEILDALINLGVVTVDSPSFIGEPTSVTPPPGDISNKLATTAFVKAEIINSVGESTLILGETQSTAYRGDRGKIAYDHSQSAHLQLGILDTTAYRGDYGHLAYIHSQDFHVQIGTGATSAFRGDYGQIAYDHSQSVHLQLGESQTTAFRGDYGLLAYNHSQSAHAPSTAEQNQLISAGNGMNFIASRTDIAIALGTPSTLTTGTTNAVTVNSHTHAVSFPVTSVAGRNGNITLTAGDVGLGNVTNESKTTMFTSPIFTGVPIAPTATPGTDTAQIATTAFVQAAIVGIGGGAGVTLGETASTAYYGDKGKIAYDHSQVAHAPSNANYYVHPANHPPSIITQDASNRFVTDTEKTTWNNKELLQAENTIRNNLGTPTVREMALFHGQFNNKFRFIPAYIQEESTDGTTWVTSTRLSASALKDLMIGEGQGTSVNGIPSMAIGGKGYYRLTWDNSQTGYVFLNHLYCYCSTNGNTVNFLIEAKHNTSGWQTVASGATNNWPGHVSIPHTSIPFSSNASQFGQIRLTLSVASASNTNPITLYGIEWFGGYPSGRRNAEYYDGDKNVTFPAGIKGTQLTSTVANGTAPLVVASTSVVANLNADLLDGQHGSYYAPIASPTFTGTPLSTTAAIGTNTTQIATTAFVQQELNKPLLEIAKTVDCEYYGGISQYMTTYALGSGTHVGVTTTDYVNHPGTAGLYNAASTVDSGYMGKLGAGGSSYVSGGEKFVFIFATGTQLTDTTYKLGFFSAASIPTAPTDAIYAVITNGALTFQTINASTATTSSTLATLSTSTWYRLEIIVNSTATSATMNLYTCTNGSLVATDTSSTNIPNGKTGGWGYAVWATVAAAQRLLTTLDYWSYSNTKVITR